MLTANAAFAEPDIPVGRIFVASHSGTMIGALMSRGKQKGVGFAGLVSIGNEVDLSIGEICASTLDDPDIDGYLLFLESIRNSAALRAFALEAPRRGQAGRRLQARPLVGRARARRHAHRRACGRGRCRERVPGRLRHRAGGKPRSPARSACRWCAARRSARSARAPPRVAVLTTTAGGAIMVVDPLAMRGVEIAQPSPETFARLAAKGIAVTPARIVDLTVAGARYDVMKAALDVLTTAPEFDLVLAVVGSSARFHPELAVRPVIDSAKARKPIAAFLVPEAPEALAQLAAAGVPSFRTPEACADAIAAALARREPKPAVATPQGPAVAYSTSSRPMRCSTGSAFRARGGRARDRPSQAPTLPFAIRSPSRFCPPTFRTRPRRAASRSKCAMATRCWRRSRRCARP